MDAPTLDITVEEDGKIHAIEDNGACYVYDYNNYCDMNEKIEAILGLPW